METVPYGIISLSDVRYKEQRVQHYQTYMENVDVVNNRFMLHLTSEDLNKIFKKNLVSIISILIIM